MNSKIIRYITGVLYLEIVNAINEGVFTLLFVMFITGIRGNDFIYNKIPILNLNYVEFAVIACSCFSVFAIIVSLIKVISQSSFINVVKDF